MPKEKNNSLAGKRVTVMGLGLHGGALGTIRWLAEQGAEIIATDLKSKEALQTTIDKLQGVPNITFVLGEHREEDFTSADLIIRNPGVPRTSPYLLLAAKHKVPVEMDSSIFFRHCPSKNIIGVTGSKGKTTTAHAIHHVLVSAYPDTVGVGTDGISPLGVLSKITENSRVVFELSSWRIEPLIKNKVSPRYAVVTSIYRDHLNTYESFEEYIDTKKALFKFQQPDDFTILNFDDSILHACEDDVSGTLFWYSLGVLPEHAQGIDVINGIITVHDQDETASLFPLADIPFEYAHEQRNVLPAILIAYLEGVSTDNIRKAIKTIPKLRHRLEIVRTLHGVTYINDSAATMPDATIAALQSMKDHPVIHILGGSDKALLFSDLAKAEAQANIQALIYLPGTATQAIKDELEETLDPMPPIYDAASMQEAVTKASAIAKEGDTVLLSPAATSFGLFQHEFDRGNQFCEAVKTLK